MKTTSKSKPLPFDGSLFAWTQTWGVTEASTLGLEPGRAPNVIQVRSHRTLTVASFLFSRFDRAGTAHYTGIGATAAGLVLKILAD